MTVKYKAFISYSHADTGWAKWLHRSLERYKIPASLVGLKSEAGDRIEVKLGKVFRDRDEFKSGSDLGAAIRSALNESEYLIVICSPQAARSKYVNQEIIEFKRLGNGDRIHGLIVEGEPHAPTRSGQEESECLPEALRFVLNEQGDLSTQPAAEVLAPDARPGKDGKTRALIKLISGLLRIDFDTLYQRERRRRQRRFAVSSGAAVAVAAAFLVMGWNWVKSSREAARQTLISAHEAYATDLEQAEASRQARDPARAIELLLKQEPKGQSTDLREFAWRHLWRLYDSHRHVVFVSGETTGLDIAPDGRTLAITNGSALVTLWDLSTGRQTSRIRDPDYRHLDTAVFVADGTKIATSGENDERLRFWDRETGLASGSPIEANLTAALSRSRYTLIVIDGGGRVRLVDALSGRETPTELEKVGFISNYAITPDGKAIALRDNTNLVIVLDAETGRETHRRNFPSNWEFKDLKFVSDDALAVVGVTADKAYEVLVWEIATESDGWRQRGPEADNREFVSVAASRDGDKIALLVGSSTVSPEQQNELLVWDTRSGRQLYALAAADTGFVTAMAFSPTADLLATGSRDHHLRLWDASTGKLRTLLGIHHGTSTRDGDRKNFHQDEGVLLDARSVQDSGISMLLFSPDGTTIVTANAELGTVRIWDADVEPDVQLLPSSADHQTAVAFSPDGSTIATGDRSGVIAIWESAQGSRLRRVVAHSASIDRLTFSATGETFASASTDGSVKLWRTADLRELDSFTGVAGATLALALSKDRLARLSSSAVTAWNLRGPRERVSKEFASDRPVALAPDGGKLAVLGEREGQGGCQWTLSNLSTGGTDTLPLGSPCDGLDIRRAQWSPDGRLLAFGGSEVGADAAGPGGRLSGIRIFDFGRGGERQLLRLPMHPGDLKGLVFSPDGRTLALLSDLVRADGKPAFPEQPAVTLFDVESGEKKAVFQVPEHNCDSHSLQCVRFGGFSPDGKALGLIVGAPDQLGKNDEVLVWNLDNRPAESFTVRDIVDDLALSSIGDRIVTLIRSGDHGDPAILWDRKTGHQVAPLGNYESTISAAMSTPDGRILAQTIEFPATGGVATKVWDLHRGDVLVSGFDPRTFGLRVTDVSSDGRLVARMDEAGSVVVRDTRSPQILASFDAKMTLSDRPLLEGLIGLFAEPLLIFAGEGGILATVGSNGISLWDPLRGLAVGKLSGNAPAAFAAAGNALAATTGGCGITIYDTSSGKPISSVRSADSCDQAVALSADGAKLLSVRLLSPSPTSVVSEAKVWATRGDDAPAILGGYADDVRAAGRAAGAFSPDGSTLATSGPNGIVSLWDPVTGRQLLRLHGSTERVSSVRFSGDGTVLVVGHAKEVWIWHAPKTAARESL
jgi:WD40 repeat protein